MAGIVISIGDGGGTIFDELVKEFKTTKSLVLSYERKAEALCLAKFTRPATVDDNYLLVDDYQYLVIGTLIYRDAIGQKALTQLNQDLQSSTIESAVTEMDGPFCLLIFNRKSNELEIITDHAGLLNVYCYPSGKSIHISSSAMVLSRTLKVTPNIESIVQFLRNASICNSNTIYNEIELLEPATIYRYILKDKIQVQKIRYWESPIEIDQKIKYPEAKEKLKAALFQSLGWIQDERAVCDVTAGYDSRTILTNLLKHRKSKSLHLDAFVYGPPGSKEVEMVKGYQRIIDIKIQHLTLPSSWAQSFADYVEQSLNVTDGEESAFYYAPILYAYKYKQSKYDLALNGLGGELYRDFWWIQEILPGKKKANYLKLINNRVLQYEYDYSIYSDQMQRYFRDIAQLYARHYIHTNSDMDLNRTFNTLQIDNIYFRQKIRRWAGRTISSSNQMIRTLAPLTFKKNLEVGMTIPPRYKFLGRIIRDVISDLDPSVAGLPMLNGTPCIPLRLKNCAKFAPMVKEYQKKIARKVSQKFLKKTIMVDKSISYDASEWVAGLLKTPYREKYLTTGNMITGPLFRKKELEKFVNDAMRPGFPFLSQLGTIATLEMRLQKDKINGF